MVKQPLALLEATEKYDIKVNLQGGGFNWSEPSTPSCYRSRFGENQCCDKKALRAEGFMTRDPREVERKKPGRPKARRRFQFSKR